MWETPMKNIRQRLQESNMPYQVGIRVALLLGFAAMAMAQSVRVFDVASIKPAPDGVKMSQTTWDPGRLYANNVTLSQLIQWAYTVTDAQVAGGPGWLNSRLFNMEAKVMGAHTREELLLMLQPLLAERFKLALHRETKEQTVYVLTVHKNGTKLTEAKPGSPANISLQPGVGPGDPTTLQVLGQSVSMRYLGGYVTNITGRVVVDRTGLAGSYDFKIEAPFSLGGDKRAAVTEALLDAISRLGLNLDSQKAPVEMLVIDHAEEPSSD
jgi:uncharacterized protein (TIGR03435 family)